MNRHEIQLFDTAELLEATSHNAYLEGMCKKAAEIEELISQAVTDRAERAAFIKDLDDEWAYMQQTIIASGIVMASTEQSTPHRPDYTRKYIEDQPMISNGFVMVPFTSTLEDEEITAYKIAYSFRKDEMDLCMLRDECIAEFPNNTVEAAERRLLYFHSDELVRIQCMVEGRDPSLEPIFSLTDYTLDVGRYDKYGENYLGDMERYINDIIPCDDALPYLARFSGEVYEKTDHGLSAATVPATEVLVQPEGVKLLAVNEMEEDGVALHIPYVSLSVYHADKASENTTLFVPVKNLHYFTSIRSHLSQL